MPRSDVHIDDYEVAHPIKIALIWAGLPVLEAGKR